MIPDVLIPIFEKLPFASLLSCCQVCKTWNGNAAVILIQRTTAPILKNCITVSKKQNADLITTLTIFVNTQAVAEVIFSNTLVRKEPPKKKYLPLVRYLSAVYTDKSFLVITTNISTFHKKTPEFIKNILGGGIFLPPAIRERVFPFITDSVVQLLSKKKFTWKWEGLVLRDSKKKICVFSYGKKASITCYKEDFLPFVFFFQRQVLKLGHEEFEKRLVLAHDKPNEAKNILFPEEDA